MPKKFNASVAVYGDEIKEYFKQIEQAEKAREPFRQHLLKLNEKFYFYLLNAFSQTTALQHTSVIDMFIEFLCSYIDVQSLQEVTKGIANSYFRRWYKKKVLARATDKELNIAVKKFFIYLNEYEGIVNT